MADEGTWSEPAGDLAAVTASLARVKRDREGVPMFLVLEDLPVDGPADAPASIAPEGPVLAGLARHYRRRLFRDAEDPGERDVAVILEVLAAVHFRGAR